MSILNILVGLCTSGGSSYVVKAPNNPLFSIAANPIETSQYVPTAAKLPNGNIIAFVKGDAFHGRIYGYKSVNNGTTFSYQGVILSASASGAWDDYYVLEPYIFLDFVTQIIYLFYKGGKQQTSQEAWGIGYATATFANPFVFKKNISNPILSNAQFLALSGRSNAFDLSVSSIVIDDAGLYHFFGTYADNVNSKYELWHGTGNSLTNIQNIYVNPLSGIKKLPTLSGSYDLLQIPTIRRKNDNTYEMIFSEGTLNLAGYRYLTRATAPDLNLSTQWTRLNDQFLLPVGSGDNWESEMAYAAQWLIDHNSVKHDKPLNIDGYYHLYYSGQALSGVDAQGGLIKYKTTFLT